MIAALLTLISVFVRRRGASPELRQQLAWLIYVGALTLIFAALMILYGLATGDSGDFSSTVLFVLAFGTPIFGIPMACAVAVLKYRLYDLDVIVKKTVVAAVLAATFTAVYVLVVVGVGAATGRPGGNPLTFVAAALAAVLLQPVRIRAGQLADRLVYGRRATPYEVLSEFSGQIAGTYSTEDVLPRMARMLAEATGARRAEVWLRTASSEQLEAAWPSANGSAHATDGMVRKSRPRTARGTPARRHQPRRDAAERPSGRRRRRAADAGNGEGLRRGASGRAARRAADHQLAAGAADPGGGTAGPGRGRAGGPGAAQRRADRGPPRLPAAPGRRRRRGPAAAGAQPARWRAAAARRAPDHPAAGPAAGGRAPRRGSRLLAQTEQEAQDALEELRDLARGIYPPLLADLGLPAALEAQARKAPLPVTVEAEGIGRYPQDVEAAVYFCVLEALQNVTKYAQARRPVTWAATAGPWRSR